MTADISIIEQELTAAIMKAVPEIEYQHWTTDSERSHCPHCGSKVAYSGDDEMCQRDITLEDVLRACEQAKPEYLCIDSRGVLYHDYLEGRVDPFTPPDEWKRASRVHGKWLLGKPLSEQSEETKRFLHSLLV